jgi:hypothetical protein
VGVSEDLDFTSESKSRSSWVIDPDGCGGSFSAMGVGATSGGALISFFSVCALVSLVSSAWSS